MYISGPLSTNGAFAQGSHVILSSDTIPDIYCVLPINMFKQATAPV